MEFGEFVFGAILALLMAFIVGFILGWPAMILFGNLHVIWPVVPALSFTQSLSIAWPAAFILATAKG